MVHPDFQGKGVFSALSSHAIEQVAQRSDLAFLFANNNSRPVYDNWGWIEVTRVLPFFRFQHPTALLPDGGGLTRPVGALLSLGARSYLRARRLLMDDSTSISVVQFDEVPAARLAALYQQAVPDALHVVRDPEYYRWRFGEPNGSWTTYLATRGGRDLGALAVRPRTVNGNLSRVDVSDGLPVGVSGREDVFKALLDRVIANNRSVDLIGDPCGAVPSSVLRDRGFLSADSPPLSWAYARFFDPLTLFVKPLSQLNVDVRDEQNWEIDDLTHNTN
jgi:hypothetical protein